MTEKAEAWRIWAVAPSEWMLRGIYIGQLWKAPLLTAECLDTPRHAPLDPSCNVGVYTFAHLEDALLEAVVLKTFRQQWMRHLNIDLTKIVLVLGVVELAGTITEWREGRLYAFERLSFRFGVAYEYLVVGAVVLFWRAHGAYLASTHTPSMID